MKTESIRKCILGYGYAELNDGLHPTRLGKDAEAEFVAILDALEKVEPPSKPGHIEVKLDFIPVEEGLPEESMRVALFLREEKTSRDRVESWRPQGTSFERFVLGSYSATDRIWFTPYRAYFAGKSAPIAGWAKIPTIKD